MSTSNKTALITGASKGIGKQLAIDLAKAGYNLGLVARSEEELLSLQSLIRALRVECLVFVGNVSEPGLAVKAVACMIEKFGKLDFMINNAGFGIFGPTETFSAEQWSDVYDTNVKGTFLFSQAAMTPMKAAGSGHIINIASDVAKRVFDGGSLYCSSKFAQDAFSAALRKEVRKDGIKVSVVYSGLVDTEFHGKTNENQDKGWLTGNDMSDAIMYVMQTPAHVVIDELMIHPSNQDY
jgi:NADP-dependent 3-hydroxy acid dehydrogenase YdfG